MDSPLVSIIVVNWNGKRYLKKCFDSLFDQTYSNIEIIMVDNGSTDDSVHFVRDSYPHVKVIENGENRGYTVANNIGAAEASGKYLLFLNNDTRVDSGCVAALVEAIVSGQGVGCWACTQLSYDGSPEVIPEGGMDFLGYPTKSQRTFYASGACLFIDRHLFFDLGSFDEAMFSYVEDCDLCWRVRLRGYDVACVSEALVYHAGGGTSGRGATQLKSYAESGKQFVTSLRRRYLAEQNTIRMLLKNYSLPILALVLPIYLAVNAAEIIFFCLTSNKRVIREVYLKAYRWNLENLSETIKLRKKIQASRKVNDLEILKNVTFHVGKLRALREIGVPKFVE
ncbi:heptose III glucuronosyltransferase [Candidatus Hakubella thermalkaliphila]|uniref:Heptose III glucuronosyltransferase n=1 Tax=Candidatus Hakubella thermalkaliphila TaxID=2754717 RepID=A0A6V8PF35_9ACTN|nr:glycosyltransferase family 2 protein [Candidatus Hakubella thermalkaliphila]MBT9168062.1 Poly-beta-1,6-N-acetyl-D-glucosamine synthase [Bacillota bacterium]GFP19777.1 heptose III glucuronosyltransferase [Candidatus Hakubella thermalkaliphila]GFP30943.1 heptose III glucuronosyltransferase [Candidatus Hakubella thermalkaliphila]GFP39703.1 heptose III glucuronosyltransferase [Candidatus Hakubella thermalkaliphila]GFP42340.1 heptose III glucuronosyltransferase [Candidatus Hakubella thermalkalip